MFQPRYLSALRTIVFSIVSTMGSVFWTSLLLVILFYLFGVLNTQIVTDHCRALKYASVPTECNPELLRFWASVPQSMLTLFLSVTNGIGWDEALQPLYGVSTVAIMSLILYIVITVLAVLNTAAASEQGRCTMPVHFNCHHVFMQQFLHQVVSSVLYMLPMYVIACVVFIHVICNDVVQYGKLQQPYQ